jgi:hypothetical protein
MEAVIGHAGAGALGAEQHEQHGGHRERGELPCTTLQPVHGHDCIDARHGALDDADLT